MSTGSKSWLPSYIDARMSRRRLLKGAASATGAGLLLAACGGGDNTQSLQSASSAREPGKVWFTKNNWKLEDETKEAVRGGIYRGFRAADQSGHFDALTLSSSETDYSNHVHEFLLTKAARPGLDPSSPEAGSALPALASAWEFSPDGTTITFTMRQGVKFHNIAPVNGRVMDIDDWRTTDERFRASSQYRSQMPSVVERAEFPDQRTMVWKLKSPFAAINELIWGVRWTWMVLPKELNANIPTAEKTAIGTGFKVLQSYQPSIGYDYRKFPEYWGGDPYIERWNAPIIPEYSNRYSQFVSGNLTQFTPTAADVLLLAKDAPGAVIVAEEVETDSQTWMMFGVEDGLHKKRPWADPRVRVAIRKSINFKGIGELLSAKQKLEAAGIPIEVLTETHVNRHPGYWLNPEKGELGDLSGNYHYDVADAKKLLSAAGFQAPIDMNFYVEAIQGSVPQNNTLVVDSLKAAGTVNLNVVVSNNAREFRDRRAFLLADGLVAETTNQNEVDQILYREYHTRGNEGRSDQPYPTPEIDALILKQRAALQVEERWFVLKEIQRKLAAHFPLIPGQDDFTTLSFRWPWLHNIGFGSTGQLLPAARVPYGGHMQWLDKNMPNRDKLT